MSTSPPISPYIRTLHRTLTSSRPPLFIFSSISYQANQSMMSFMALDDDIPMNAMASLRSLSNLQNVAKIQLR